MISKDRCPKCKGWQIYAEHSLYNDKWRIHCQSCGLSTKLYDTWKQARQEWESEVQNESID